MYSCKLGGLHGEDKIHDMDDEQQKDNDKVDDLSKLSRQRILISLERFRKIL